MGRRPPLLDPDALPEPDASSVAIRVRPAAERALRDGHPWLFEGGVASESRNAPPGTVGVVFDRKNRFLAAGLLDPESPIRVRLLVHGEPAQIGEELFHSRIRNALARRSEVASHGTTGFRAIHGENDGLPGLVADLYDRALVLRVETAAWLPHLRTLLAPLRALLAPDRVFLLASRPARRSPVCPPELAELGGAELRVSEEALGIDPSGPNSGLPFVETGLHFEAHPFVGQKTGFYLDQRENRRRLEGEVRGGRILNVFSYTGAFSVYAARAGAEEAVDVDRAEPALRQAERHFKLNREDPGVAACRHRTIAGDAFAVMEELGKRGEEFDTVVVDPPSFTRSAAHRDRALRAYGRLTRLALPLLSPGGLLVQASCSSRAEPEAFYAAVENAVRAARRAMETPVHTGHPADHPVGFPEGTYLKCLWARRPA